METIVSYPERGNYGKNSYRGNCSGLLIKDIVAQYKLRGLSDFMVGSGTTEDVVHELGIRGSFTDLNRGFDMLSMDIPERPENIFWHPPYGDMIKYAGSQYDAKAVQDRFGIDPLKCDISQISDWNEFVKAMNYCMLKQFNALEKGGRMFVLMGDMKRHGKLYSMLADIAKPGTLEQIIIKTQHNTWSGRQSYSGNFVPIVHEYLLVTHKDASLLVPVTVAQRFTMDLRQTACTSWRDAIVALLQENAQEMTLEDIYDAMKDSKKTQTNRFWKEKVRQTVQNTRYFRRTARGTYALAA